MRLARAICIAHREEKTTDIGAVWDVIAALRCPSLQWEKGVTLLATTLLKGMRLAKESSCVQGKERITDHMAAKTNIAARRSSCFLSTALNVSRSAVGSQHKWMRLAKVICSA
jgi:hypothetical protein